MKRVLRSATEVFDFSLNIFGLCTNVYNHHRKQDIFHISVLYGISWYLVSMELQCSEKTKNGGVAMSEPPQDSAKGLVYHSWNRAFCYRLPVLFKLIRLLF